MKYTKKDDIIFDPFVGSGTTAYESEVLGRNFLGIELKDELVKDVNLKLDNNKLFSKVLVGDSTNSKTFDRIKDELGKNKKDKIQLAILHPPYADILQFSNLEEDLSNKKTLKEFLESFSKVLKNTIDILENDRYLAIVIGDKYANGQWIPLGFYCMNEAQKIGMTLKSVIIKNMEGNRAKRNKDGIWRYRALSSDYYIFKHEYIFIFKK